MRALFVSSGYLPASRGGTDVHAHALASELARLGHQVSVFCREGDPGRPEFATREWNVGGIPVFGLNYNFADADEFAFIHRNPRIEEVFSAHLDRVRPDVVHVHHLTCLSTGILDRAADRKIPLVMTLHDFWMVCGRGQRIRKELEVCEDLDRERCAPCLRALWPHYDITPDRLRFVDGEVRARLLRCGALISPSRFHRDRMLEFGLDARRMHVVEHGLAGPRSPGKPRVRDRVRTIGYIGSVIPTKGVHLLVEAFNRLARPDLRLRIHGDAPVFHGDTTYLDRLRAMPHAGLDVRFDGAYEPDRVFDLLDEIDLLVVPSLWWEAFCLTIREGFLAGIPVVASDLGAMLEAFEDGKGGVHFRAGDPGDLHRKLLELVDDPERYRRLLASIPDVRPVDSCARETLGIYEQARAGQPRPAQARTGGGDGPYATVFIPTWNGGPLFERVLDKVLAQKTSFDYEVLVIDSGSKDSTVEVVRRRPRVRLIEIPNSEFNHGLTRNRAVREASGEVVALLTQDAEPLDEEWLERLVRNFDDPRVAGAYCHQLPRPDCNPFQRDRLKGWTKESGPPVVKELPDPALLPTMHPFERYRLIAFDDVASCVRKSVMLLIPFEKRQFGEDIAWAKQAILGGWKIVNDPGAVVIHSHDSPVLYEFRRVFLDHQNIHDLVGLHTIPKWWMVPLFSVKAFFHLTRVVWKDDRGFFFKVWWTLKTPLYAFTQNLAQYLGAKSVGWKREGRLEWFDRRMRKGSDLRILHVVHGFPPDSIGGTELHVAALAAAQARKHEVRVFGPGFREGGGTSFLERTRFAPAEARFRNTLEELRPDVVHVHHLAGLSAGILGIAADAEARVVLTLHDHALACPRGQRIRLDLDPCPVLDRDRCVKCVRPAWIEAVRSPNRLDALLGLLRRGEGRRLFSIRDSHLHANLARVSSFIAPSRSAADLFLEFYPPARPRMNVIPHGIHVPGPLPALDPRSSPFTAGYFGALLPTKGVRVLAEVARGLEPAEFRIVLNGGGAAGEISALRRRSRGRLEVAGPYRPEDLSERMARVHAVLVPSLWPETFSIVLREAWAHRRPVLASETGALIEAAGPEKTRVGLVPPGDVPAWTAAIRRLASDRSWYAQLAGPHEPEPFDTMLLAIERCYTQTP